MFDLTGTTRRYALSDRSRVADSAKWTLVTWRRASFLNHFIVDRRGTISFVLLLVRFFSTMMRTTQDCLPRDANVAKIWHRDILIYISIAHPRARARARPNIRRGFPAISHVSFPSCPPWVCSPTRYFALTSVARRSWWVTIIISTTTARRGRT